MHIHIPLPALLILLAMRRSKYRSGSSDDLTQVTAKHWYLDHWPSAWYQRGAIFLRKEELHYGGNAGGRAFTINEKGLQLLSAHDAFRVSLLKWIGGLTIIAASSIIHTWLVFQ